MSEKNLVAAWVKNRRLTGQDAKASAVGLQAAALAASLRPGLPARTLHRDLTRVIAAIGKLGNPDGTLSQLAADERFPGWARLLVALHTDDVDLVADLSRYTMTLTRIHGMAGLHRAPGLVHLPVLRRVQFAAHGALVPLSMYELEQTLPQLNNAVWQADNAAANLARCVDFTGADFTTRLTRIGRLEAGSRTRELRAALVRELAEEADPLAGVTDVHAATVQELANAFADVDPVPPLRSTAPAELVVALLSSPAGPRRRFGVALAAGSRLVRDRAVLTALARTREGGQTLRGMFMSAEEAFVVAKARCQAGLLDEVTVAVLDGAGDRLCDPKFAGIVTDLADVFADDAWVLAYLAVPTLAACHNYPMGQAVLPDRLRPLLAAAAWLDPTPAHSRLLVLLPYLDPETVDKARCVLAEEYGDPARRYVPTGLLHGDNGHLIGDLVHFAAYACRGGAGSFETGEDRSGHHLAWMRALSAVDAADLLAQVAETRARLKETRPPEVVKQFLDEAFSVAGNKQARDALARALAGDGFVTWAGPLPASMTLLEYAASLNQVMDRIPAAG